MSSSLATRPAPHTSTAASASSTTAFDVPHITTHAPEPMDTSMRGSESLSGNHGHDPADPDARSADGSKNASPPDTGNASTRNSSSMTAPPPAAAALHQPKIVQTAFIHKLYNMLEDRNIQHLISWSSSADSFVMAPTPDFSKVLSQYFKHTNISSFVRQLNMYGFHKERDVFHTGNPESTLWEFKHGGGNFKRGDLVGLREIKRRASRHALVHRESAYSKATPPQPPTPTDSIHMDHDGVDRLASMEHSLYDLSVRLQRSEDSVHYMQARNQAAVETMSRLLYFNQELARTVQSLASPEDPALRDCTSTAALDTCAPPDLTHRRISANMHVHSVAALQNEMARQADMIRSMEETSAEMPFLSRQQYLSGIENAPVSPRQIPSDDSRRNLTVPQRQNFYRPPVPSNLSVVARRPYGSIGGAGTAQPSPSRNITNPVAAPPPGPPHPLANVEPHPASLGRRHTSADIRAHGWHAGPSPYSTNTSTGYPSSPTRAPPEDQRIRESLSAYSLHAASHQQGQPTSRPTTPPPPPSAIGNAGSGSGSGGGGGGGGNGADTFGNWSWGSAAASRVLKDSSGPPTRRGSMAHILNPSDTAERSDEDEDPRGEDDRKRKRVQ
ncbi:HSF protein, partial [Geosmithia morbida]